MAKGLVLAGVLVVFLGLVSPIKAWLFWQSSGRQEAVGPVSQECIAKANAGRCDFYTCFDQRHPCDNNNYALNYGWRFCSQFELQYSKLNEEGQRWINATRKCTMAAMLEFYNDDHINCGDVEAEMVAAHGECEAANGLCSMSLLQDNKQVFEDIYAVNERSARRLLEAMRHCGVSQARQLVQLLSNRFETIIPDIRDFFTTLGDRIREGFTDFWEGLPFNREEE